MNSSGPPSGLYAAMFDAAGVGLLQLSPEGQVQRINPSGAAFLGRSVAELTGMNVLEITHPEDIPPTLSALGDVLADRSALVAVEKRYLRPDGSVVWSRSRVSRLSLPGGERSLMAVVADITQLKETQLALRQAHRELEQSVEASLLSLGVALEARDLETQGHTERVVALSTRLGEALGMEPAALEALRQGAYLHDIGKLGVPDAVLLKPGVLDPHEWALMQSHAARGHEIARHIPLLTPGALAVIRHHHERWDGDGYPDRLRGEAIPLAARVFAVCDVYDALTSKRPYKDAWTPEAATEELRRQRGQHFDSRVIDAFLDERMARVTGN